MNKQRVAVQAVHEKVRDDVKAALSAFRAMGNLGIAGTALVEAVEELLTLAAHPAISARVRPFQDESGRPTRLLAFAELDIAGAFVIKGIRVLQRAEGEGEEPFVVFPAEKGKGSAADRWFDLAHPITAEARTASVGAVLAAYKQATEARTVKEGKQGN